MALYEYICPDCGTRTDKRMPMTDVLQSIPCPHCGKTARKALGGWAVVGVAQAGVGDGPPPWDGDDGGLGDMGDLGGGHSHDFGGHGHSHGPGTHTH
jgi:putative FmdB family regulatory protein